MMKIRFGTGFILLAIALAAHGAILLDTDFSGPTAALAGNAGWIGRDAAIQLNGSGLAGLGKGADGFVKHPLTVPANAERIRFSANVKFSALPGSNMRNHHIAKEQPAWVALGFTDNSSEKTGMTASKLSVSVSSDGQKTSIGLGQALGAAEPVFGAVQAAGDGSCELALEYDFTSGTATALWNGTPVLTGKVKLTAKDFAVAGFQLRRIASSGGIEDLKIECTGGVATVAVQSAPQVKPEVLGSRINPEAVRAKEIEARIAGAKTAAETIAALKTGWENPPSTYRTHTRWWWPGNAVTKEGIDFQLQEMKDKGFGGTEPMNWMKVYEKGNLEFESPEFMEMMKHAVDKSRELGMFITPPLFPGWGHGNADMKEDHLSKAMLISATDVTGGQINVAVPLPAEDQIPGLRWAAYMATQKKQFEALVAVALNADGTPDPSIRVDLTGSVAGDRGFAVKPVLTVKAELPAGRWRLMTFWTCFTGQKCACESNERKPYLVDHLNKEAVQDYLSHSGGRYVKAFGGDFGQTVDSFFGDSYELAQDFSLWSTGLFERFKQIKGYDLRPYLPMLLYDGAPETPYVRYDVGHFLHLMGMEGTTQPLTDYCGELGIQMRQQPHYRFTAELIEASGTFQRPETENTKRSFDPMMWHKLTASGAALYPSKDKKWVSAEAFTFIKGNYRATMEEIKRATDLFLRDGITQFYNHGYYYSPEKEIAPARALIYMNRISHLNTWWPWFRGLADYQARGAYLNRQGRAEADILVYAPMPTLWSERAEFPCKHVRDMPFGTLPKILVANGYDFDCVNDDLLLNHAQVKDGRLVINGYDYSVLILPRAICLSPETLGVVAKFVEAGGTVLALEKLPEITPGLAGHETRDAALHELRDRLFATTGGDKTVGKGATWFFPKVEGLEYLKTWEPGAVEWAPTAPLSAAWKEVVDTLHSRLTPDFEIAGKPQSDGLTFRHTRIGKIDCWFLTNLQPDPSRTEVTLKTDGGVPQLWDALTGKITTPESWRYAADGRLILPVHLEPWASCFVLLQPGRSAAPSATDQSAAAVLPVEGPWQVNFAGLGGVTGTETMAALADWTTMARYRYFSGTATYTVAVDVPAEFVKASGTVLDLGSVCDVASVRINGKEAGKVWMQPYRVPVGGLLKPGLNTLEITVANQMWNYCAGLKEPNPIPEELRAHYGATGKKDYRSWDTLQRQKKQPGGELMPSGLIGPVTLKAATEIIMSK